MAQKVQTLFIDDIDGGDAEGTVRFALDRNDLGAWLSRPRPARLPNTPYLPSWRLTGCACRKRPAQTSST